MSSFRWQSGATQFHSSFYMNDQIKHLINQLLDQGLSPEEAFRQSGLKSRSCVHKYVCSIGRQRSKSKIYADISHQIRKYFPDIGHFQQMDEIGQYWLGFIYADGCHTRPPVVSIGLQIHDYNHLIKLADDLSLPYGIVKISNRDCHINVCCRDLSSVLCYYGINPNNAYKRHVPKLDDYRHYMRGLFDGDGCITFVTDRRMPNRKLILSVNMAITYESYGRDVQNIIESVIGKKPRLIKERHANSWRIELRNNQANTLLDWMYDDANRYLDRKYERYVWWKAYLHDHKRPRHECKSDSIDRDKFDKMWTSGEDKHAMRNMFNICIGRTAKKFGLSMRIGNNMNHRYKVRNIDEFIKDWLGGMNRYDIAKKFRVSVCTVMNTVSRLKIGSRCQLFSTRRISSDMEQEFIKAYNGGHTVSKIAEMFNMSRPTVRNTAKRLKLST